MKIAVLFGSFNPFTNAHMSAMKTAIAALQADEGLFVATNGQYLRKKTVKRNDPFYLTEEERKTLTEATKIYTMRGLPVYLVQGAVSNIKITTPADYKMAQAIAEDFQD